MLCRGLLMLWIRVSDEELVAANAALKIIIEKIDDLIIECEFLGEMSNKEFIETLKHRIGIMVYSNFPAKDK